MARTTRKQVESVFGLLCRKMGNAANGWELDYAACYGGYQITANKSGELPFGAERRSPGEMWSAIRFALDVLYLATPHTGPIADQKWCGSSDCTVDHSKPR